MCMATFNITLLITLILYAYRLEKEVKSYWMKRYNLIVSDAPKVGYTTYLDWWFFPIFYYTCFALFEFIFVQVISSNIIITLLINILLYLQSLIGEKRETLAKNVEFFSRVLILLLLIILNPSPFSENPSQDLILLCRSSSLPSPSSSSLSTLAS